VVAAANPFGDPHAYHRAQLVPDHMRGARVVPNLQRLVEEDGQVRRVRVADDARDEVRVAANAWRARAAEVNREEAIRRRQEEAARRREEDRGWCVLM
jgi:hypothetical protein